MRFWPIAAKILSGVGGIEASWALCTGLIKAPVGLLVVAKSDMRPIKVLADRNFWITALNGFTLRCVLAVPSAARSSRLMGLAGTSHLRRAISSKSSTQLARHKTDRQRQAVVLQNGKHAVTRVRVITRALAGGAAAVVECKLETGRTHQIRVHMSYAGHALLGDQTYSRKRKLGWARYTEQVAAFPRQALHAGFLGFKHPI